MNTKVFLALILIAASGVCAMAQGQHGQGHDAWHEGFYSKLMRPDMAYGNRSCCSLTDCRPTVERRSPQGYYEVLVDGTWVIVPRNKIVPITAPDGGAHVCAPKKGLPHSQNTPTLYCVVLPPES